MLPGIVRLGVLNGIFGLLLSCSSLHERNWDSDLDPARLANTERPAAASVAPREELDEGDRLTEMLPWHRDRSDEAATDDWIVQRGSGRFVGSQAAAKSAAGTGGETITLNFEKAELAEVISFVLGDLLQKNYTIDPRVQGSVTLHTSKPMSEERLLPLLESLLQVNSAALVVTQDLYQVVPVGNALLSAPATGVGQRPSSLSGFVVQVVPLRFIGAAEMARLLKPVTAKGVEVSIDETRNLLTIAAPQQQLVRLLDTVQLFDVDWIKGLSVGIYPLKNAAMGMVVPELERIFRTAGNEASLIEFEPLERLNAILVISKQPAYLQRAGRMIEKLDTGDFSQARQLRVYPIRNGKAEYFAELLQQLFGESASSESVAAAAAVSDVGTEEAPVLIGELRDAVRITPDPAANNILVMASVSDHRVIEAALRKMEVRPRQVLIEATIAEVSLTDNLAYGLQWFIKHGIDDYDGSTAFGDFARIGGGFATTFSKAGDVRLLFDALASDSKLKILSSPQLMVIDKQTGSIRVGDSIPIVTRQSTSVEDPLAPIAQEVQYRDTGVLLHVVPNIHSGGLVKLEVSIEVSQPGTDTFAAGNVSFLQRTIDSSVVVQSGETVVLGGLILENESLAESGVPLLSKLPLVGKLFSRTVDDARRTELMVTLTPRVVETQDEAEAVTDELRQRLKGLFADQRASLPTSRAPDRRN